MGKTFDPKHINHRGPLEYQLPLPSTKQALTRTQKLADSHNFVRAQTQHDQRRLQHQRGGHYNYGDSDVVEKIERGPTNDGSGSNLYLRMDIHAKFDQENTALAHDLRYQR